MKLNVGNVDRIIRLSAGAALVAWAVLGGPLWAFAGAILLATGFMNFCPLYALIGINTGHNKS